MPLNSIQTDLLEGILAYPFDLINALEPKLAIAALKAIVSKHLPDEVIKELTHQNVIDEVQFIRKILEHPRPENRYVGDPTAASDHEDGIINDEIYWWSNGFGSEVLHEPRGLLGLSAYNNKSSRQVTKLDIATYIKHQIYLKIGKHQFNLRNSTWEYCNFVSGKDLERTALKNGDIFIFVDTPVKLLKRKDDNCISAFDDCITVSLICHDPNRSKEIIELLNVVKSKIKRRIVGNVYQDEIIKMKLFKYSESVNKGGIFMRFYRGEGGESALFNILNVIIFNGQMPEFYLNALRYNAGQDLYDYEEDIAYEEMTGTYCQRQAAIEKCFGSTEVYSAQEGIFTNTITTKGPVLFSNSIFKLIHEYDLSSAIDKSKNLTGPMEIA